MWSYMKFLVRVFAKQLPVFFYYCSNKGWGMAQVVELLSITVPKQQVELQTIGTNQNLQLRLTNSKYNMAKW
jgi:hypothetical protein